MLCSINELWRYIILLSNFFFFRSWYKLSYKTWQTIALSTKTRSVKGHFTTWRQKHFFFLRKESRLTISILVLRCCGYWPDSFKESPVINNITQIINLNKATDRNDLILHLKSNWYDMILHMIWLIYDILWHDTIYVTIWYIWYGMVWYTGCNRRKDQTSVGCSLC